MIYWIISGFSLAVWLLFFILLRWAEPRDKNRGIK